MNALERYGRRLSDSRLDDTATEINAVEEAQAGLEEARLAMADGYVDQREQRRILWRTEKVLALCRQSLDNNVREQPHLDGFFAWLGLVPAEVIAGMPRIDPLDVFFDADMRNQHPELGQVTVGQLVASRDYGEAA